MMSGGTSQISLSAPLMPSASPADVPKVSWFAMRDLKRGYAKDPAYRLLSRYGMEVFTPLTVKAREIRGRRVRCEVPVIPDMLFVHATRETLDPVVRRTPSLQYRFKRGAYCEPLTVREEDMQRFILAVNSSSTAPCYYLPEEITSEMMGKKARIIGGPMEGREVVLQRMRGTKRRRFFVDIPGYIVATVEIEPELLEIIS